MTEKLPPISTHIAPPALPAIVPNGTFKAPLVPTKVDLVDEDEPYTIKCICDFLDDDGNTIYCETCDSWQHIECYYPDNVADALREDFAHSCVDCKPRPVDRRKAVERQRLRLDSAVVEEEAIDKKPKRPASKNPRKKTKPNDIQINGHASAPDTAKHTSPHDRSAPPKKAKISHKSTHSTSSQAAKRSPSYGSARTHGPGHPTSPSTALPEPPTSFDLFSCLPGFYDAYGEQAFRKFHEVGVNSHEHLTVMNKLSTWPRDPIQMRKDTGLEPAEVFITPSDSTLLVKQPLDICHTPFDNPMGAPVPLRYLKTPSPIPKDTPLLELNGSVGLQQEYCTVPDNRYNELTTPLPFVFFHDKLPLVIDTRHEGSDGRYVRRSCRPNARLDIFLLSPSECHFWFVSDRNVDANEAITIPWDFRLSLDVRGRWLRLLGLSSDTMSPAEPPVTESEYAKINNYIRSVLGEYGGCACDLGNDCSFSRFHRNYHSKFQAPSRPPAKKRQPKSKQKPHTISPSSTGQATNSRAPSEGHMEDAPENDRRSVSGSARSKPPSRDRTPAPVRHNSIDGFGILTEPTEREKRKAAALEESVRRMEQQPRKKKRVSDGTTSSKSKPSKRNPNNHPSVAPISATSYQYVDAGTSRSKSRSPSGSYIASNGIKQLRPKPHPAPSKPRQLPATPRPAYRESSTQTEPDEGDWYAAKGDTCKPRRRIVSLSKRLLETRHRQRLEEERRKQQTSAIQELVGAPSTTPMDLDSPSKQEQHTMVPKESTAKEIEPQQPPAPAEPACNGDLDMPDAASISPTASKPTSAMPPPSISPSTPSAPRPKAPELRMPVPPAPTLNGPSSTATTPLSASGSTTQSPSSATSPFPPVLNGVTHSTPQRKKLSLSDYTKSRMNKGKPSSPLSASIKPPTSSDGNKISPGQENHSPSDKGHEPKINSSEALPTMNGSL